MVRGGGIVNITVPKNELIVERSVQLVAKTKGRKEAILKITQKPAEITPVNIEMTVVSPFNNMENGVRKAYIYTEITEESYNQMQDGIGYVGTLTGDPSGSTSYFRITKDIFPAPDFTPAKLELINPGDNYFPIGFNLNDVQIKGSSLCTITHPRPTALSVILKVKVVKEGYDYFLKYRVMSNSYIGGDDLQYIALSDDNYTDGIEIRFVGFQSTTYVLNMSEGTWDGFTGKVPLKTLSGSIDSDIEMASAVYDFIIPSQIDANPIYQGLEYDDTIQ